MSFDHTITKGTSDKIIEVMIRSTADGQGLTGLAHGSVTCYYTREGGTSTQMTLSAGTAGLLSAAGQWAEVDSTNQPGLYQVQLLDAMLAALADAVTITFKASGAFDKVVRICLIDANLRNASNLGLSNLDAAVSSRNATTPLSEAGIRSAVGLTTANLDVQIADLPTVAEFNARTLAAASYFDPATDTVANVTDVANVTTLSANAFNEIQNQCTAAIEDAQLETLPATLNTVLTDTNELQGDLTNGGRLDLIFDQILADTNELQTNQNNWLTFDHTANNVNANIVSVTSTPVTSVDDFKGSGGGGTVDANIISVTSTPVTSVDDFKGSVASSGLTANESAQLEAIHDATVVNETLKIDRPHPRKTYPLTPGDDYNSTSPRGPVTFPLDVSVADLTDATAELVVTANGSTIATVTGSISNPGLSSQRVDFDLAGSATALWNTLLQHDYDAQVTTTGGDTYEVGAGYFDFSNTATPREIF